MEKRTQNGAGAESMLGASASVSDTNELYLAVNRSRVKVVFADDASAPTAEEILAKILIGRMQ